MDIQVLFVTALITAVVSSCVSITVSTLVSEIRRRKNKSADVNEALRAVLRSELLQIFIIYVIDGQGTKPLPLIVRETADSIYKRYHDLGGNGTGTYLYDEICKLETTTEWHATTTLLSSSIQ